MFYPPIVHHLTRQHIIHVLLILLCVVQVTYCNLNWNIVNDETIVQRHHHFLRQEHHDDDTNETIDAIIPTLWNRQPRLPRRQIQEESQYGVLWNDNYKSSNDNSILFCNNNDISDVVLDDNNKKAMMMLNDIVLVDNKKKVRLSSDVLSSSNSTTNNKDMVIHNTHHQRLLVASSSQINNNNCVYNEKDIRFAISNALNYTNTTIYLCSPYITIDTSKKPNAIGVNGILILNKILNIECHYNVTTNNSTTTKTSGCILDAQHKSRIFVLYNSIISFHDIIFQNGNGNKDIAYPYAGSMYIGISTIEMINCNFINNVALNGGGMVIVDSNFIMSRHNSNINNNPSSPLLVIENNTATKNGGFIYAFDSNIEITNYHFMNNKALYAGALGITNTTLTLLGSTSTNDDDRSIIQNNIVKQSGGFLYAALSNVIISKYDFMNNIASNGGAILLDNSTMILWGGNDNEGPGIIQENKANENGGFMHAHYKSNITISNYHFMNNSAGGKGGGLLIWNATLTLQGTNSESHPSIIENNIANDIGGFIYGNINSSITINQYQFSNNSATNNGGAICIDNSKLSLIGNEYDSLMYIAQNNTAKISGGFIEAYYSFIEINKYYLNKNIALFGGAIFELGSILIINSVYIEQQPTATATDGAIALIASKTAFTKVSFSRPITDIDSCDMVIYRRDEDETDNWFWPSRINFPPTPPPQKPRPVDQDPPTCVTSENELRDAVDNCKKTMNGPSCIIDICVTRIEISRVIDISNKNIILSCQKPCPTQRCIIDGQGYSRMFYGSYSNITLQNFIFSNGFHPDDGGSIKVVNNSIAMISNCSFVNNNAAFGSAVVAVNNTKLIIEGLESSIINNTGIGPPIEILSSRLNISHTIFAGNNVSGYHAASVLIFNATIEVSDVQFLKSTAMQRKRDLSNDDNDFDDCDVYVPIYGDNFTKNASCMNFAQGNQSFPVIDLSENCMTILPVTAPPTSITSIMSITPPPSPPVRVTAPPTYITSIMSITPPPSPPMPTVPSPNICFSGNNIVETKDLGNVQMSQLRIGDYVKSGRGMYTQVYGFGHFNHDEEGKYLYISFHSRVRNKTSILPEPFLEISPRHLVFIKKHKKLFPIRAADVGVGDELSGQIVKSIQYVVSRGIYAPLTQSGDIVVSGIFASNYVDVLDYKLVWNQHTLGHFIFTPQRVFCYYFMETCKNEIYINGYGVFANLIVLIASIANEYRGIFNGTCILCPTTLIVFGFIVLVTLLLVYVVYVLAMRRPSNK